MASKMLFKTWLRKNYACANGKKFASNKSLQEVWETIPYLDWMKWLIRGLSYFEYHINENHYEDDQERIDSYNNKCWIICRNKNLKLFDSYKTGHITEKQYKEKCRQILAEKDRKSDIFNMNICNKWRKKITFEIVKKYAEKCKIKNIEREK